MDICFTGPRPKGLYEYERDKYLPLLEELKKLLASLYDMGCRRVITGGAQGLDQLAFWAVNALKRKGYDFENIVYVPFRGQERRWAKEGLFSQKEYHLMLKLADEVHILSDMDINEASQRTINGAMYNRNHKMVDDTDATIGIYPDFSWEFPETKSGTAECMRYAKKQGKTILWVSPETLKSQWIEPCVKETSFAPDESLFRAER